MKMQRKNRRIVLRLTFIVMLSAVVSMAPACRMPGEDDMSINSQITSTADPSDTGSVIASDIFSSQPDSSAPASMDGMTSSGSVTSGASSSTAPTAVPTTVPTTVPSTVPTATPVSSQVSSAASSVSSPVSEAETNTGNISLMSDDIILHGRILRTAAQIGIDWSCSGIELFVRGGKVEVTMDAVDTSNVNCTHIGVYINGVRTQKIRLQTGNIKYLVAENLPANQTTSVKILKLNEVSTSQFTVTKVELTGTLQPDPALKVRKIEFVGDSITTGYGNLCTGAYDPFWSETQDGTLAYPGLVADELNALYNVVAAGGNGVFVQPRLSYKYVRTSNVRDFRVMWDFNTFKSDVIVINLGTNDIAQGTSKSDLDTAITDFLTMVRTNNPNAQIVWAYGLMYNLNSAWIKESVENFAASDMKVHYLQFTLQNIPLNGTGSSSHPNTITHQIAANELTAYLRTLMSWN